MINQKTLGIRIRFFRNRSNISQLNLENEIGMSAGSLSRIESGGINPTKETIIKIAKILNLTSYEIQYLIGPLAEEATIEEIQEVRKVIEPYLKKRRTLAYIVDDRSRLIDVSNDFLRLGNLDISIYKKKILGEYLPRIILDESFGINQFFDKNKLKEIIYYSFARTYDELNFMDDDIHLKKILEIVNSNSIAKEAWEEFSRNKKTLIQSEKTRTVTFNIKGLIVPLKYSIETLWFNPKFKILEYAPTNIVHKLFMRLT